MPLSIPNDLAVETEPSVGPHVVNQVFTAATGWGYAARCGCGWKTAHAARISALMAGQRHLQDEHGDRTSALVRPDASPRR